jgi:hypothetical protein
MMRMFKKVYEDRMEKKKAAQMAHIKKHKKELEKINTNRLLKRKKLKKEIYKKLGKKERNDSTNDFE